MDSSRIVAEKERRDSLWPHGLRTPLPLTSPEDAASPVVAVVIRTKDRPLLLRRACESVLAQSFSNWTLVIVNDGGNPSDVEAAVRPLRSLFGERITLVHNPTSRGMEGASNVGVRASRSRYVVIHDDDDSWEPEFLSECVRFLDDDPNGKQCAGVATQTTIIREEIRDGRIIRLETEDFNPWQSSISLFRMAGGNTITNNSFVFRRSVFDSIGGFNEQLPVLGDWEFNLRVLARWEIGLLRKKLANYHHRVNLQQTTYGNTVIGGAQSHYDFDAIVRNQLLRRDLGDDGQLMGLLVNMSRGFELVSRNLDSLHHKMDAQGARLERLERELYSVQYVWWALGVALRPVRFGWHKLQPLRSRVESLLARLQSP